MRERIAGKLPRRSSQLAPFTRRLWGGDIWCRVARRVVVAARVGKPIRIKLGNGIGGRIVVVN